MTTLVKTAILSGVLVAVGPGIMLADPIEKKGTTPYATHFIFRPVQSLEVSGLGTATLLEAIGTTQNMKGEKMLDKMSARCTALSVDSGSKKYIDGACVLADADGDKFFSTFDTRDVDKSQPNMNCGTHVITGGTGKYAASAVLSHLHAMQCLQWLGQVATPQWISLTTRRGRSSNPGIATACRRLTVRMSANDAVDGAHSAASKCQRVVA